MLCCLIIGLAIIVSTAYLPAFDAFSVGKPAPRAISASQTVTVLDSPATDALREDMAALVEPVRVSDPAVLKRADADLKAFFRTVDDERAGLATLDGRAGTDAAVQDAVGRLRIVAPTTASDTTLILLLQADTSTYDLILTQAVGTLQTVFTNPITDSTLKAARQKVRSITESLSVSVSSADAVYEVTAGFVRPNQIVDEHQTMTRRQAAMDHVAPVTITVLEDTQVVREGEVVTEQDMLILRALRTDQTRSGWDVWLGILLLIALAGLAFFRLIYRFNRGQGLENIMLLALVILQLFFTLVARLLIIQPLSAYLIPVAAIGMIVTIILNARTGFLMTAIMSLNVGILSDLDMRYSLVAIIVGMFSVYLVSKVVQRVAMLGAAVAVMVIAAFTIFSVELFQGTGVGDALRLALWGLANGLLSWVLTVIILLILDTVFNLNTPLRLLELANPAHPLLRRLLQVAPGTYNHSVMMGNLAEAAAEAIGANPLLARVGAYYHDIGKVIRPEYFVENQIYVDNPHDRLSPNLSKLAIAAHVRDGENLAKQYGLPSPVLEIIRQHHGTSVIAFFYHKARKSSKVPVDEENYRYEEEKPRSKEAAIIMLADGTEAAVRALSDPTRRKIQGMIQEVFKQKIEDGQLDDSDLTLADLRKIREAFDVSMRGLAGHRLRYPDKDEEQRDRPGRPPGAPSVGPAETDTGMKAPGASNPPASGRRVPPSAAALRARRSAAERTEPSEKPVVNQPPPVVLESAPIRELSDDESSPAADGAEGRDDGRNGL
jgi:putative nucleotidyltransferase with HDIG domain